MKAAGGHMSIGSVVVALWLMFAAFLVGREVGILQAPCVASAVK